MEQEEGSPLLCTWSAVTQTIYGRVPAEKQVTSETIPACKGGTDGWFVFKYCNN